MPEIILKPGEVLLRYAPHTLDDLAWWKYEEPLVPSYRHDFHQSILIDRLRSRRLRRFLDRVGQPIIGQCVRIAPGSDCYPGTRGRMLKITLSQVLAMRHCEHFPLSGIGVQLRLEIHSEVLGDYETDCFFDSAFVEKETPHA